MTAIRVARVPSPTARLRFRTWALEDLPLAIDLWGDVRVTDKIGGPFGEAQIRERLAHEVALLSAHDVQYWPIFLIEGAAHVGCCGLRPRASSSGVFELGFHIRPEHWGRGLATEAARATIAHAFENADTVALFAGHHPENHDSRRVLEKLGFRHTHDEIYPPTGLQHPSYALTREQ